MAGGYLFSFSDLAMQLAQPFYEACCIANKLDASDMSLG
jgi:hypothetical protein